VDLEQCFNCYDTSNELIITKHRFDANPGSNP